MEEKRKSLLSIPMECSRNHFWFQVFVCVFFFRLLEYYILDFTHNPSAFRPLTLLCGQMWPAYKDDSDLGVKQGKGPWLFWALHPEGNSLLIPGQNAYFACFRNLLFARLVNYKYYSAVALCQRHCSKGFLESTQSSSPKQKQVLSFPYCR